MIVQVQVIRFSRKSVEKKKNPCLNRMTKVEFYLEQYFLPNAMENMQHQQCNPQE